MNTMQITHSNFVLPRFSGKNAGNDSGSDTDDSCNEMMAHLETLPLNANRFPGISISTSLLHHPDVLEKIQAEDKPKARERLLDFVSQFADSSRKYASQPLNPETRSDIKGLWKEAKNVNPKEYKTRLYNRALSSDEFVTAQQKVTRPLSRRRAQDLDLQPSVIEALNKEAAESSMSSSRPVKNKQPTAPIAANASPGSDTDESCNEMMAHLETLPLNANRFPFISMSTSLLHHPDVLEKIQAENKPQARERLLDFATQLADRSGKYTSQPLNPETRSNIKGLWKETKSVNPKEYKTRLYNRALSNDEFATAQQKVARPLSHQEAQALDLQPSVLEALNKEAAESSMSGSRPVKNKQPIASASGPGETSQVRSSEGKKGWFPGWKPKSRKK